MSLSNTLPIVGARFRPPAEAIIRSLAIGTPLFLFAEPTNAYDPNAIAVWINSEEIPSASQDALEAELPRYGFTLEKVLSETQWHLGYVPKEMAAKITASGQLGSAPYPVTFSTNPQGQPRVRSEEPFYI